MLISQQNQLLHTFPRTIFSVKNFTVGGYSCMPDKIPIDRRISYPLASNLYKASLTLQPSYLCLSPPPCCMGPGMMIASSMWALAVAQSPLIAPSRNGYGLEWSQPCTAVLSRRHAARPAAEVMVPVQDSEELLRNLHLAPYAKPIVSLIDDFPMVQRHKGWQFGFLQGNATRKMTCAPL